MFENINIYESKRQVSEEKIFFVTRAKDKQSRTINKINKQLINKNK